MATGSPTPGPVVCTKSHWTPWINKDTPEVGNGDFEKITPEEIKTLCPGGMISQIQCFTIDGIKSESTGEVMDCSLQKGSSCSNLDNYPAPCSDFKVRYFCDCSGK